MIMSHAKVMVNAFVSERAYVYMSVCVVMCNNTILFVWWNNKLLKVKSVNLFSAYFCQIQLFYIFHETFRPLNSCT